MRYLSIHFHPISTREFVRSVSRELDDWPLLTRADPDFCSETRETMYEDEDWDFKSLTSLTVRMRSTRNNRGGVGSNPIQAMN